MSAYYNEIDPYAAEWLRNLIKAGHIADGTVDTRSIVDVEPMDLRGFVQCHFFAGVGVWSYALKLTGWSDDRPVWTGSCPCQPFSAAGAGGGFADERHLWPHWHHLIRECRPRIIFGEQVASKDGLGWLDLVLSDMEGADYAIGAFDLCAAGVGAPHIRQRLYWVAHAECGGCESRTVTSARASAKFFAKNDGNLQSNSTNGHWGNADWLKCRDGKRRPVEPGTFPLAHGIAGRVGRLRAYGNAIVPQVAAEVIKAFMETLP